jgi:hypothetical protein
VIEDREIPTADKGGAGRPIRDWFSVRVKSADIGR